MGCNCKKTFNKMEKYSDNYNPEEIKNENNIFIKIITYILQIGFGILVGCISICILPIVILWLVICIILHREPSIRIKNNNKNKPLEINKTNNGQ